MTEHPWPPETWHARDRDIALAECRVIRLRLQLAVAEIDHIGLLLRDNLIAPAGARAWLADLTSTKGGQP